MMFALGSGNMEGPEKKCGENKEKKCKHTPRVSISIIGDESRPKRWARACAKAVVWLSVVLWNVNMVTRVSLVAYSLTLICSLCMYRGNCFLGYRTVHVQFRENTVQCREGAARNCEDNPGGCGGLGD